MGEQQYRIWGLSRLEVEGIRRFSPEDFRVEEPAAAPEQHNELATLAVIGGIGVVAAAAGYFFGKHNSETIKIDVETIGVDGSRQIIHIVHDKKSNEPIDTQIMSQAKSFLGP